MDKKDLLKVIANTGCIDAMLEDKSSEERMSFIKDCIANEIPVRAIFDGNTCSFYCGFPLVDEDSVDDSTRAICIETWEFPYIFVKMLGLEWE